MVLIKGMYDDTRKSYTISLKNQENIDQYIADFLDKTSADQVKDLYFTFASYNTH